MKSDDSILSLKGIGQKTANSFSKLHIQSIDELLHHYPRDYEAFEEITPCEDLVADEMATIRAVVITMPSIKKVRNLSILSFFVRDKSTMVQVTYFNMPYLKNSFHIGKSCLLRGRVLKKNASFVMEQPKVYEESAYALLKGSLQPLYPLTEGLTQNMMRKAIRQVLDSDSYLNQHLLKEYLPPEYLKSHDFLSIFDAYLYLHFPDDFEKLKKARKRLAFDEFFRFLWLIRRCKEQNGSLPNAKRMKPSAAAARLSKSLPYQLTNAQKRTWEKIQDDLGSEWAMSRLIQGDVGSGKTILAILSLLQCVENGYQGAMMAPTEVLSRQHFEDIEMLTNSYNLPFRPVLLTGSLSAKQKRIACQGIENGDYNIIVGTNALIQEKVMYSNLGLVVTDEQHRFGVRQREALAGKGEQVHVLIMSATPIPRTLALVLYSDLKVSVVDERPALRIPVKNCVVGTEYRKTAYHFMKQQIEDGRQVYIICPMVEEGEMEGVENVMDYTERLKNEFPPEIRIAFLHGKMKPQEKDKIMNDYKERKTDILVSTTVIEVGINVPNATVMMIENAERFGLAQLHQLRGRVGRGKDQSYCIFVSSNKKEETIKRLEILNHSNDGFYIAQEDLKLRGPGDFFGIRQSGSMEFQIADIYQDADVLSLAAEYAESYVGEAFENFVDFPTI